MNLKSVSIAVALLAAAAGAAYLANRPAKPSAQDPRIGAALLAPEIVGKTAELRLTDQGKSIIVKRVADGTWAVPSYYDFPADFQKLSQFVEELAKAKVDRFVTASPERLARFEFKDTRIILADTAGNELFSLTLGKNTDGGGRLIRFGEENKAYQSRLATYLDAEPRNWADASLLGLKAEDVASVELGFADAPSIVASRAKKEDPFTSTSSPAGQRLKSDRVTGLLGSLASLRFSDTSAVDDPNAVAAKANSRTLSFTTFGGKKLTLTIGRKPEQKIAKAAPAPTEAAKPTDAPAGADGAAPAAPKAEPQFETIPAGPVYAFVASSDAAAPINGMMQKRSFQIYEYAFTSLPAKADEFWEAIPAAPTLPTAAPATKEAPVPATP